MDGPANTRYGRAAAELSRQEEPLCLSTGLLLGRRLLLQRLEPFVVALELAQPLEGGRRAARRNVAPRVATGGLSGGRDDVRRRLLVGAGYLTEEQEAAIQFAVRAVDVMGPASSGG
jgi:hypothetical protein